MANLFLIIAEVCRNILNKLIRISPHLQEIVWKIYKFYLTSSFKTNIRKNIKKGDHYAKADPFKIVHIDQRKIIYHTVFDKGGDKSHFKHKVFDPWDDVGRIVGGDWDKFQKKFVELPIYKSFEDHFERGVKWEDTNFFQNNVKAIKREEVWWGCSSINDFKDRCKKIDLLYENIKKFGYKSQRAIAQDNIEDPFQKFRIIGDEITVNIGRMGDLFFNDGRHRLCIAKILNIKEIPVRILVRHEKWQKFRDELVKYTDESLDGKSDNELPHPDLRDIPTCHNSKVIFNIIKNNLGFEKGRLLDIGSNLGGYFCHKFEELGFDCYAVEHDPRRIYFMKKLKKYNDLEFKIIDKSIFDFDVIGKKFNAVLALNVFHNFLHKECTFKKFLQLLKNLNTEVLFLQCPSKKTPMMKNAYREYVGDQFVEFIIENSSLNEFEYLGRPKNDKPIYKLIK